MRYSHSRVHTIRVLHHQALPAAATSMSAPIPQLLVAAAGKMVDRVATTTVMATVLAVTLQARVSPSVRTVLASRSSVTARRRVTARR